MTWPRTGPRAASADKHDCPGDAPMRWQECLDLGLIRPDARAIESIPGSLASAARFLSAAEKNVAILEYEMAHLATYNSASHSIRTFLYSAGYLDVLLSQCGTYLTIPRSSIS
ncbi:hypothetical protein SAMN04488571_1175 [Methanoculleus thermophilus]|uniref:Uncharacterized protein n=2 Tax=Methanoculleus thermophilus TaxID=2200 RepID=A0A1G9CGP6_9EURY|nr:hypothetical protein SAMN04488571_1175 [Methanoculleus thermophilus]